MKIIRLIFVLLFIMSIVGLILSTAYARSMTVTISKDPLVQQLIQSLPPAISSATIVLSILGYACTVACEHRYKERLKSLA